MDWKDVRTLDDLRNLQPGYADGLTEHCRRNGWRDFGQFKNQGRCVAFVVRSSH